MTFSPSAAGGAEEAPGRRSRQSCLVSQLGDTGPLSVSQSCQECSRSVREPVSVLRPLRDTAKEKFSTAMARSEYLISQGFIGMMWIKTSEHAGF